MFGMAGVAAHPQEAVLETAAFEEILKFPLVVLWQCVQELRKAPHAEAKKEPGLRSGK
jgi:hypothetical protein